MTDLGSGTNSFACFESSLLFAAEFDLLSEPLQQGPDPDHGGFS